MDAGDWSWGLAQNKETTSARQTAVIQPDRISWDYPHLNRLVKGLGARLRSYGLSREDTVAVAMPDGAAGLVTQLAVMGVCACAPLNPLLTETELLHELTELGVRAFICEPDFALGLQIANQKGIIAIAASVRGDDLVWQPQTGTEPAQPILRKHNEGAAILLHTSATTGRRKVVPLSRENLEAACANTSGSLGLTQQDRLLVMARLFHAQGILSALAQWSVGGTVVVTDGLQPASVATVVSSLQVTWYTCGPTLHQAILVELRKEPLSQPHSLRVVRSGGNTLAASLKTDLEQQLGVPVLDMYGLSETGAVAADTLDAGAPKGWRSVGPEISIRSHTGEALATGEEGEIVVRGPSVMRGYWNDDDANPEAFWGLGSQRWFRTGDLGHLDERGVLTLSGRAKEIINRGGQKIQPGEVDQVLSRHPAIQSIATFAIPHRTLGEDVACAVVLREGFSATPEELQAFARQSLARYKVPRRLHLVTSIPHGATGKPQRLVLRERFGTRPVPEPGAGAYSSERKLSRDQRAIAELWSGRLQVLQIRLEDDFFHLGGDSLEAVSMLSEVEALLERKLSPGATERFFEAPTMATLSASLTTAHTQIETTPPAAATHAICRYPLLGNGPGTEAFLFPADDEEGWYFRLLSRYLGKQRRMSLLRPANGFYPPGPDLVEIAAAQAVGLIRERQPHGPYLVGGFCLGGLIAYEAARLLEQNGQRVLLVLFDTPVSGEPHPVFALREYARELAQRVDAAKKGERSWRRVAGFPLYILRRWLWLVLSRTKKHWRAFADRLWMRQLRLQAEHAYLPLYRPASSHVRILHFVMSDGRDDMRRRAVYGWGRITFFPPQLIALPGSHHSLFSETNLERMTEAIEEWVVERGGEPPG